MPVDVCALVAQKPPTGGTGNMTLLVGIMLFFVVFMIMSQRGKKKEQRERQNLLDNLSKNDRVMTIGGILGTITTVRENEVVLKVDESSNTKVTFLKKSIQQVLQEGETPDLNAR